MTSRGRIRGPWRTIASAGAAAGLALWALAGPVAATSAHGVRAASAAPVVVAAASATAAPPRPTLFAQGSRQRGEVSVTITGTAPRHGRLMLQQRAARGEWSRIGTVTPGPRGRFRTLVDGRWGRVSYRVVLTGPDGAITQSAPSQVDLRRPIRVTAHAVRAAVPSGGVVRLQGAFTAPRAGAAVELVRSTPRGGRVVARGRSSADGSFSLAAHAPVATSLRTPRYHVRVLARPTWEQASSRTVPVAVAPRAGLVVDRSPVYFRLGPGAGAVVDVPVELAAGQATIVDASAVTPDSHSEVDLTVLDPSGEPAGTMDIGDPGLGSGLEPTLSGTYTVRLTLEGVVDTFRSGLVWVSTPRMQPIEVDGAPADIPARTRPGQTTWLTFERDYGDRIAVGCVAISYCSSGQRLVAMGYPVSEQGQIGPGRQDLWYPIHTGPHYLEDTSRNPVQVWVTSANQDPLTVEEPVRPLDLTRPGQAAGFVFPVEAGRRYTVSVVDRGLVGPAQRHVEPLVQPFDVAASGHLAGGGGLRSDDNRHTYEGSFTAAEDGTWLLYVDPVGPAIGPMDLDVTVEPPAAP